MSNKSPTFVLDVAREAIKKTVDELKQDEREALLHQVQFDSSAHDVYEFSFKPVQVNTPTEGNRRYSFEAVNRILVEISPLSKEIHFLRVCPTLATVSADGFQVEFHFTSEMTKMILDKPSNKRSKRILAVDGELKNKIRKDIYGVYAYKDKNLAQWVFLDSWIKRVRDFSLKILCIVPKTLSSPNRGLTCRIDCQQDGRSIQRATKRRIELR